MFGHFITGFIDREPRLLWTSNSHGQRSCIHPYFGEDEESYSASQLRAFVAKFLTLLLLVVASWHEVDASGNILRPPVEENPPGTKYVGIFGGMAFGEAVGFGVQEGRDGLR